jgi:hypothetical protein
VGLKWDGRAISVELHFGRLQLCSQTLDETKTPSGDKRSSLFFESVGQREEEFYNIGSSKRGEDIVLTEMSCLKNI